MKASRYTRAYSIHREEDQRQRKDGTQNEHDTTDKGSLRGEQRLASVTLLDGWRISWSLYLMRSPGITPGAARSAR